MTGISKTYLEFDIETATLAINCKTGRVVTRNGRPVIIIKYEETLMYPIEGVIIDTGALCIWNRDGKYDPDGVSENDLDLFIEDLV